MTIHPVFTDAFRTALVRAANEARRIGSGEVDGAHLLLGLTCEPDATADAIWEAAGTEGPIVYWRTMSLIQVSEPLDASTELPYTESAREVLRVAVDEADAGGDRLVGTEHLLLGLIREGGLPAAVLRSLGLLPGRVRWIARTRRTLPASPVRLVRDTLSRIAERLGDTDRKL